MLRSSLTRLAARIMPYSVCASRLDILPCSRICAIMRLHCFFTSRDTSTPFYVFSSFGVYSRTRGIRWGGMPVADYGDYKVLCPFWSKGSARENKIFCEGFCPDARLQLWFKGNEKKRKAFIEKYCSNSYAMCPAYRITEAKYNERG